MKTVKTASKPPPLPPPGWLTEEEAARKVEAAVEAAVAAAVAATIDAAIARATAPLHAQIKTLKERRDALLKRHNLSKETCRSTTPTTSEETITTDSDTSSTATGSSTGTAVSSERENSLLMERSYQEVKNKRRSKKTNKSTAAPQGPNRPPTPTPMEVTSEPSTSSFHTEVPQVSPPSLLPPPTHPHQPPPSQTHRNIPPIFLRDNSAWEKVTNLMETSNIVKKRSKQVGDAIRIQLHDNDSHDTLHKLLLDRKILHHTFDRQDQKPVRAVIRGIPVQIETSVVHEDIAQQGFNPIRVTRMCNLRTKRPIPLLFVVLPNGQDNFLSLTKIVGLDIKVEIPHKRSSISQCHNCQGFYHTQNRCYVPPRCVKCAGEHHTRDCPKTANEPPCCLHCSGAHPASYKGCPKYPKTRKPRKSVTRKAAPPPPPASSDFPTPNSPLSSTQTQSDSQTIQSYAKALRNPPNPSKTSKKDIVSEMGKLMADFMARLETLL